MKILIVSDSTLKDGVCTYVKDFTDVFSINHSVFFYGKNPLININMIVEDMRGEYDICFAHIDPAFRFDFPVIFHIHYTELNRSLVGNFSSRLKEHEESHLTVNCQYQKKRLVEFDVSEKDITVIPNMINELFFKNITVDKKKNSILYMGRLYKNEKIYIPLIKAMKYLPDYTLTLMGASPDNEVLQLINENNIKYIGSLSGEEKLKMINEHEIGIGVGRSMMEMALCGIPTLVYMVGYEGWLTEDNVMKLQYDNYSTRSYPEISEEEKIQKIIEDITHPKYISREKAENIFGLNKNISDWELLFDNVKNKNFT